MKVLPPETLRAFFDAVEINDVVDAEVSLPEHVDLGCADGTIRECFALCRQFWQDGVDRANLVLLVEILLRTGDLAADERISYKHIRARYKQLRFALRLYGQTHRLPRLFGATVVTMGRLQDAYRNDHRSAVLGQGLLLRAVLAKPLWDVVERQIATARLDTTAGFLAYRTTQICRLKSLLEQAMLTGREFHEMRKIVSQQVSFYDALRSLGPNNLAFQMSRYLSAINGLMGARHDAMVEREVAQKGSYRAVTPLDASIRHRLEAFVARCDL